VRPGRRAAKPGGAANVPSPWPSSTLTLLLSCFATATSSRPSPLKSPTATARGNVPTARSVRGRKEPSPLLSSTLMVPLLFAVTRSRAPLPSKSPAATERGVGRNRAGAVAQQDLPRRVPARGVQGGVEQAVAVEVAHRHRLGDALGEAAVEDVGGDSRLERSIAVAQQHAQAALGRGGR